ncbi:MAG: Stp1/IreP family PP2C-type Ser/Thr phosphatase [Ignavibacteriaceae bacterium]|nr:Stp1/IreP family PP2C-type Ser/Thr phosphatase [Ignavibacteriaceae bacterium]
MSFVIINENHSDTGKVRAANEDYFGSYAGSYGDLIIVCDGMGGYKGGATASKLAVENISEHFAGLQFTENTDLSDELNFALERAHYKIREKASEDPELKEMGSTAAVLLLNGERFFTAHAGDSRVYLIRKGQIHQITKDHSLVQKMVDSGMITQEEAKNHPRRNVILNALGAEKEFFSDVSAPEQLFEDDIFVLCSDGLNGHVEDDEIYKIATEKEPRQAVLHLVKLANDRGGKDNITVQIVKVQRKGKTISKDKKYSFGMPALVVLGLLLLGVSWLYFSGSYKPWIEGMFGKQTEKTDSLKTGKKPVLPDSTASDSLSNKPDSGKGNAVPETGVQKNEKGMK